MTIEELKEKYDNIEDKIPSNFVTYEEAGKELQHDIYHHFFIQDAELIRVICLLELRVQNLKLNHHIDKNFSFAGLYPEKIKSYNIKPDPIK